MSTRTTARPSTGSGRACGTGRGRAETEGVEELTMTYTHASRWSLLAVVGILVCTMPSTAASDKVRIIQTNSAGDNVHVIDPATNKVVGVITGIEVNHGAAVAPDGSRIYISDEDVVAGAVGLN